MNELETGQTVNATAARAMPCRAFARLAEGVEGLIHVTEFGSDRVADPAGALRVPPSAHEHCPEGGHIGFRTYNRNEMMPAPVYGPEEL